MPPIEGHEIGQTEQKKENNIALGSTTGFRTYYSIVNERPGNEKAGFQFRRHKDMRRVNVSGFLMLPSIGRRLTPLGGNSSSWRRPPGSVGAYYPLPRGESTPAFLGEWGEGVDKKSAIVSRKSALCSPFRRRGP